MNVQETSEIRELSAEEVNLVAGGHPLLHELAKMMVGLAHFVAGFAYAAAGGQ
jgi:hypothetical protein